jgi:PAS domain S-box-containing protein
VLTPGGGPQTVEFRVVRPDGEIRLLQAQGLLVPAADGQYTRVIGTSLDITERRATELALRASEESYRTIFDHSNDAVFVHDIATGAVLDANRRACEFSDVTLEELRENGLAIIANGPPPFTPDRAVAHMQRAAAGEAVRYDAEVRVRGGPGRMTIDFQVAPLRDAAGRITHLIPSATDVSARVAAETALRDALAALQAVYDTAPVGLCVFDRELRWTRINARLAAMNGFPPEAHLGRRVGELLPGLAASLEPVLRRVLETPARGCSASPSPARRRRTPACCASGRRATCRCATPRAVSPASTWSPRR